MCDRVLVLESGHLNYDSVGRGGSVDEGITYLQYDDDADDELSDEELGADV